jgi:hypothetical protein
MPYNPINMGYCTGNIITNNDRVKFGSIVYVEDFALRFYYPGQPAGYAPVYLEKNLSA